MQQTVDQIGTDKSGTAGDKCCSFHHDDSALCQRWLDSIPGFQRKLGINPGAVNQLGKWATPMDWFIRAHPNALAGWWWVASTMDALLQDGIARPLRASRSTVTPWRKGAIDFDGQIS